MEGENVKQNSHNVEPYPGTLTHGPEEYTNSEPDPEPEKKSVMSMVKEKARKVRDSIKKHGQNVFDHGNGHDNEIQHIPDDGGDLAEDKQMVQDQKNREVPSYDSEDVKSATPTPESEKVENSGNSGIEFEGTKFTGQEPHHASLVEGVSSTTETNQNIATDKAKLFAVEDKAEQSEANLKRQIDLEEDSQEQGSRAEAYTLPTYQTKDTNPNVEVYDNEDVKSATPTPESEQVENLGNSGTDFEGTKIKGEELHHDSLVEGVSSTTEINQNIANDKTNIFSVEEKPGQYKANLERPIGLEEDSQEQENRSIGEGSDEIKDITPLEESLERMNVHDESKPTTEPKIQSSVADSEYPSDVKSHDQFVPHFTDATKTQNEYPQETLSTDINRDQEILEEDSQDQGSRTETYIHPNYPTKDTDPSGAESNEIKDITPLEESLERMNVHDDEPNPTTETKIQPFVADIEYPPAAGSHDQFVPHFSDATETQNEYPRETASTDININHENPSETEKSFNAITNTVENQSDATEIQNEYPQETVSADINRNHEIPFETEETLNTITHTGEKQPYYDELVEIQSKQKSYPDEVDVISSGTKADKTLPPDEVDVISSGTKADKTLPPDEVDVISSGTKADKTLPLENDETSKLSNDGTSTGSNEGTETKNGDKGAPVKDYLAEKPRPSEEDKALSEVISEPLHKGKEEPLKKEDGILASEDEKSEKVFEESNVNSPGKGMVDRVKNYYGSWFAKPEENQSPQGVGIGEDLSKNKDSVAEVEQVGKGVDEGRTHE